MLELMVSVRAITVNDVDDDAADDRVRALIAEHPLIPYTSCEARQAKRVHPE
jgi:hypothetical protein